jgi:hypothetical protein
VNLYEQVIRRWKERGVPRNPAVSLEDLGRVEETNALKLPPPLRRLLLLSNGMSDGEYDPDNQLRFWSLEELALVSSCAPELASPRYERHLVFADYSVWSHAYAVSLDSGEVVVVGDEQPVFVTGSVESFLAMYVSNAPALFPQTRAPGANAG